MADAHTDQQQQAQRFLRALFGDPIPDGTRIALWDKQSKRSTYHPDIRSAASLAGATDLYVTASLAPATMSSARRRPKARESAGIPGVWIDVDIDGGPENKTGRAPSLDAALELAGVEAEPTILVDSGHGVHAWWLLDEPWVFGMGHEREQAARITQGWETIHRNHAVRRGYGVDSTHDLARLMRLPGTLNGKGNTTRPVRIISDDGPRYGQDRLAEVALTVAPIGVTEVKVDFDAGFPKAKFDALMEHHDFFRKTWNHQRKDREAAGWTMSEYDLALASIAVSVNWTDDEAAALIREHREKQGDPIKGRRVDYLERTISRAHNQTRRAEQARLQNGAAEDVNRMREDGTITGDAAYSKINQAFGAGTDGQVPTVKELVQYSEDPDEARYVMAFADGREANIGPWKNLRNVRLLDERLGPVIGQSIPKLKDDVWHALLNAVLPFRTLREEAEPQAMLWVRSYLEGRFSDSATREGSARSDQPFAEDGWLYVRAEDLAKYIRVSLKEQMRKADLIPLLAGIGFERANIHFNRDDGNRSTASWWRAPKEAVR